MNLASVTRRLAAGLAIACLVACDHKVPEPAAEPHPPPIPETPEPADLAKEDVALGTGAEAKDGDKVKVNYTGKLLKSGFVFDTSVGPGKKPFEFTIGTGGVIKGWDQGVPGMKVGGKRKLTIPSKLGYGDKGSAKIPGKATLVFDIELLQVGADPADAGADGGGDAGDGKKKK